ncbi:MAG: hypothetical protein ACOYKQ_12290, partial [Polymorphobacter sp.]
MLARALAAALIATSAGAAPAPVLFVFAHPDDEIIAAPLIAGLARRGVPRRQPVIWGGLAVVAVAVVLAALARSGSDTGRSLRIAAV